MIEPVEDGLFFLASLPSHKGAWKPILSSKIFSQKQPCKSLWSCVCTRMLYTEVVHLWRGTKVAVCSNKETASPTVVSCIVIVPIFLTLNQNHEAFSLLVAALLQSRDEAHWEHFFAHFQCWLDCLNSFAINSVYLKKCACFLVMTIHSI